MNKPELSMVPAFEVWRFEAYSARLARKKRQELAQEENLRAVRAPEFLPLLPKASTATKAAAAVSEPEASRPYTDDSASLYPLRVQFPVEVETIGLFPPAAQVPLALKYVLA